MIESEFTNEEIQKVEEGLSKMENSARRAFVELFPHLDYDKDFSENTNFSAIEYLLENVEKAIDESGYERYGALHQLMVWTVEGLYLSPIQYEVLIRTDEDFRKDAFELLRSLDKDTNDEFLRWMENRGFSNEEIQNPDFQADAIGSFFSEKMFRSR